jgi:hypothetical protein
VLSSEQLADVENGLRQWLGFWTDSPKKIRSGTKENRSAVSFPERISSYLTKPAGSAINFWQQPPLVKVWGAQTSLIETLQLLTHFGGAPNFRSQELPLPRARVGARGVRYRPWLAVSARMCAPQGTLPPYPGPNPLSGHFPVTWPKKRTHCETKFTLMAGVTWAYHHVHVNRYLILHARFFRLTLVAADGQLAGVENRPVTIYCDGVRMAADLFSPKKFKPDQKLPALILCNGTGGTKAKVGNRTAPSFA